MPALRARLRLDYVALLHRLVIAYYRVMDINLIVMNVGNTRLAMGVFAAGELKHVHRVPLNNPSECTAAIADAWKHLSAAPSAAIVAASVNPSQLEHVEHLVHQQTGRDVLWIGRDVELPVKVLTSNPAETGVDRVLNIAAAYEQIGKPCVVVDAGTAITIDCCNEMGDFVGGAIAPGVTMMIDALHEKTAKLPRIEFARPDEPFGTSTAGAIRQGIFHGIRGMVKELVENYATALGMWPDLIATGGDAAQLFDGWELVHAIAPDLTLYGIALAYTEHVIRSETAE